MELVKEALSEAVIFTKLLKSEVHHKEYMI